MLCSLKKNRLLIVSYDTPPNRIWGVADNISSLYKHLSKEYIVDIASKNKGLKSKFVNISTDKFVDECLLINKFRNKEVYKDFELLIAWNLNLVKRIKKFYSSNKTKPSIIHCHSWLVMIASKKIAEYYNVPLVYTAHFLEKQYSGMKKIPTIEDFNDITSLENDFFSHCDAIITFGKVYKNFLVKNYDNVKSKKIFIIPHGVEIRQKYSKKKNIVLFVGRLVKEKGVYDFLKIARRLKYSGYKFVIIGTGPLEKKLKENYYSSKNLIFKGQLSRNKLYEEYSKSKIYCSLSHVETFGLTKLEAALTKNVIITTRGSRIEKVFPKKIVFSVPVKNIGRVIKILLKLIESNRLVLDKSEKVYKYAKENYSVENMITKTRELYKWLLKLNKIHKKNAPDRI